MEKKKPPHGEEPTKKKEILTKEGGEERTAKKKTANPSSYKKGEDVGRKRTNLLQIEMRHNEKTRTAGGWS